jgi:ATP diphosphatase
MSEKSEDPSTTDLRRLIDLVARLRAPDGCPWDRKQRLPDVRAYLLEEAHELAAAVDTAVTRGDWDEIRGEAGDLLFQVAFLLQLAHEEGAFEAGDVLRGIHEKMVARHPHVFGEAEAADAEAVSRLWETRKARERGEDESLLDGVAPTLPALLAAYRLSQKAAGVGFDWPSAEAVLEKVDEERQELREVMEETAMKETAMEETGTAGERAGEERRRRLAEEVGDLLFTVANLARKLGLDPEAALAGANAKFRRRFQHVERTLRQRGHELGETDLETLERVWDETKARER